MRSGIDWSDRYLRLPRALVRLCPARHGGCHHQTRLHPFHVYCFDPRSNSWSELPALPVGSDMNWQRASTMDASLSLALMNFEPASWFGFPCTGPALDFPLWMGRRRGNAPTERLLLRSTDVGSAWAGRVSPRLRSPADPAASRPLVMHQDTSPRRWDLRACVPDGGGTPIARECANRARPSRVGDRQRDLGTNDVHRDPRRS